MGPIVHDWAAIPLAREINTLDLPIGHGPLSHGVASCIGNPHVTFFVPELAGLEVKDLAHPVLVDPLFPEQVDVGLSEETGPTSLRLQVYERPGILTGPAVPGSAVPGPVSRCARHNCAGWSSRDLSGSTWAPAWSWSSWPAAARR